MFLDFWKILKYQNPVWLDLEQNFQNFDLKKSSISSYFFKFKSK